MTPDLGLGQQKRNEDGELRDKGKMEGRGSAIPYRVALPLGRVYGSSLGWVV